MPRSLTAPADRMVLYTANLRQHQLDTIQRVAAENGWTNAAALREIIEWYVDFARVEK